MGVFKCRPTGSYLLHALLHQLSSYRPGIETNVAACNELRRDLMEDLRALLANDEGLQLVLQANLQDDGRYEDGLSLCRAELPQRDQPSGGGSDSVLRR